MKPRVFCSGMLSEVVLAVLFCALIAILSGTAAASDGLTLGPGRMELAEGDAANHEITANALYWNQVTIPVASDGSFSYSGTASTSDAWVVTNSVANVNHTFSGTYEININGSYDAGQKTFSGDFSIGRRTIHDYKSESTDPNLEFTGQGHRYIYDGTFSGKIEGSLDFGGSSATLVLSGTDSYSVSGHDDSGKPVKDSGGSFDEIQTVHFSTTGEFEGQAFDEYSAIQDADAAGAAQDEDSVTILSIHGDATVSDPQMTGAKQSWPQKYWRALRLLTGRVDDPDQPWRIWTDPEKGMKLTDGFQLKTGDGEAVIKFKDGTRFIVHESSKLTFTSSGFTLDNGNFTFSFTKKGSKIYLQDRRGKWSIIGTQFEINTGDSETSLKVYEGSVETESLTGAGKVQVNAGEELIMTDSGLGGKTALSAPANHDMDQMEREIVSAETHAARIHALTGLGILISGAAAVALAVIVFLKRRRKPKEGA